MKRTISSFNLPRKRLDMSGVYQRGVGLLHESLELLEPDVVEWAVEPDNYTIFQGVANGLWERTRGAYTPLQLAEWIAIQSAYASDGADTITWEES